MQTYTLKELLFSILSFEIISALPKSCKTSTKNTHRALKEIPKYWHFITIAPSVSLCFKHSMFFLKRWKVSERHNNPLFPNTCLTTLQLSKAENQHWYTTSIYPIDLITSLPVVPLVLCSNRKGDRILRLLGEVTVALRSFLVTR